MDCQLPRTRCRWKCARSWCIVAAIIVVVGDRTLPAADPAQDAVADAVDDEFARQQEVNRRYLTVLERNPRRGTAFDKIYGFHVENGLLDSLVEKTVERTTTDGKDGTAWMILGMIESQRGRDAPAVEAFTRAKELRATDALPAYYLGQSLILLGQPDKAIAAFEEAIARKPAQGDMLPIFQALGRLHQQMQQVEQAIAVWKRLEELFPGDARVQEDIASTLVDEGQYEQALPRYEALTTRTNDDYRRTVYQMQAADLKIKLNRADEGIADLEKLLATLNPQSWLFRDVRRQIEDVYLHTNDDEQLAKYYSKWLETNAEDIDAMVRLSRVLSRQARVPEAREWLERALKLAPSRKELRLAFIEQLVDDQRYPDAITQYVELDKADPNNPDYLRDWGKLILRDKSRPIEDRKAEAEKIWRRLAESRANDPLVAAQVADLFRYAEMPEPALALYQRAVELAPSSPQYLEYLGEYYHVLDRKDEANSTWRKMTDGSLRTAANLSRLAEVLVRFGYLDEALGEIEAACALDPKEFSLYLKSADFHVRAEKYDAALTALGRAERLAQNDEERELVLNEQLKIYSRDGRLPKLAESLEREIAAGQPTHRQRFVLARYYEELRNNTAAAKAIDAALKLEPNHVPTLTAAARIVERSGGLESAAALHRKLAAVDRRARTAHLERVATLEAQIGRIDAALAAGRELLVAAPGNVETHQFFADLCFRLGQPDEALKTLRRAVRANPNEQAILISLATALTSQYRTDEAIELYWQAFDKGKSLESKLTAVEKLAELYSQTNQFDRLQERLERNRQGAEDRRELTICLSQAYYSASDYGLARQELERLLGEDSRDTQLLQQLSKLAEAEYDFAAAVRYQEQLVKIAPGPETEYRLAMLLPQAGRAREAAEIIVRLSLKEEDRAKQLRNIDGLLAGENKETALQVIEARLRDNPRDWELLYREGVAYAAKNAAEASRRFEALLALDTADDVLSTEAQAELRSQQQSPQMSPASFAAYQVQRQFSRLDAADQVRQIVGLDTRRSHYWSGSGNSPFWAPPQFGTARMAALGWLYRFAEERGSAEELVAKFQQAAESDSAATRAIWDWLYLCGVRQVNKPEELTQIAKQLAERDDQAGQFMYLTLLGSRNNRALDDDDPETKDTTPPLSDDELKLVRRCCAALKPALGGDDSSWMQGSLRQILMCELKRAGRLEEEQALYDEAVRTANNAPEFLGVMAMALQRKEFDTVFTAYDRFAQRDLEDSQKPHYEAYLRSASIQTLNSILSRKDAKPEHAPAILEHYWTSRKARLRALKPADRWGGAAHGSAQWQPFGQQYQGGSNSTENRYFDEADGNMLRGLYQFYAEKKLVGEFVKILEDRASAAEKAGEKAEQIHWLLAQGNVLIWYEDVNRGLQTMARAAELEPADLELRMSLAQSCLQAERLEESLAQLDVVEPLNQTLMQQREVQALDLALRLANTSRARLAAKRLFGLRTDPSMQLQLAGQMRRLGMNAEAAAVMARVKRQAGNQLSSLVSVMAQYQSEGQLELAAEVAHQILRRSRSGSAQRQYWSSDSSSRTSAIQCLAKAGKLPEIIARTEAQLERSPQSAQLLTTLAEYYEATGKSEEALELQMRMVESREDDASLRYRFACQLLERGQAAAACDQFKLAIAKAPGGLPGQFGEMSQAFQAAGRSEEFAKLIADFDVKAIPDSEDALDFVNTLLQSKQHRELAAVVLKKVWTALPNQRSTLIENLYRDKSLKLPGIHELAKQSLLPTTDASRRNPWHALDEMIERGRAGRVETVLAKVLAAAQTAGELTQFRREVEQQVAAQPKWLAGKAILAIIDVRLRRPCDVRAAVAPLLDPETEEDLARLIVGQEIELHDDLKDLAIEIYRASITQSEKSQSELNQAVVQRLVALLIEKGQREAARTILLAAAGKADQQQNRVPRLMYRRGARAYYSQSDDLQVIGNALLDAGFPLDSLRIYRRFAADMAQNSQISYSDSGSPLRKVHGKINSILDRLDGSAIAEAMQILLARKEKATEKATADEPAIDLLICIPTSEEDALGKIESLTARLLSSPKISDSRAQLLLAQLDALAKERPEDFSVSIAATLTALPKGDVSRTRQLLDRLQKQVADAPLATIADAQEANTQEQARAAQQVPLWLVARECLRKPDLREIGEALAERALAAAELQSDPDGAVAMLHERGLMAIAAKDPAAAERYWNRMLELTVVRPRDATIKRSSVAAVAGESTDPPSPQQQQPVEPAADRAMPVTLTQFAHGASIAELAAKHNLQTLSLRAMREVVAGGLPVTDLRSGHNSAFSSYQTPYYGHHGGWGWSNQPVRADIDQNIFDALAERLPKLSAAWEKKKFPPAAVYDVLAKVVLPDSRPGEVLIYEQSLPDDWSMALNICGEFAKWAQRAGRIEAAKEQIAERRATPSDIVAGEVLLAHLQAADENLAGVSGALEELGKLIDASKSTELANTAAHAVGPLFANPKWSAAVAPQLQRILAVWKPQQSHGNSVTAASPRTQLVQYYLRSGRREQARKVVDDYFKSRQVDYGEHGSEYGKTMKESDLAWAANQLSGANHLPTTLDILGQLADATGDRTRSAQVQRAVAQLASQIRQLPAAEQYSTLRDWTLPGGERLRLVAAFCAARDVPETLHAAGDSPHRDAHQPGPLSNSSLLNDAAHATGRLDELAASVRPLAERKVPGAAALAIMLAAAQGDSASVIAGIEPLIAKARHEFKLSDEPMELLPPSNWEFYLAGRAALQTPKADSQGKALFGFLRKLARKADDNTMVGWIDYELAQPYRLDAPAELRSQLKWPQLKLWLACSQTQSYELAQTWDVGDDTVYYAPWRASDEQSSPTLWVAHERHLKHFAGGEIDRLFFRYPLEGEFEFHCDLLLSPASHWGIGYGGLRYKADASNANRSIAAPLDEGETVTRGSNGRGRKIEPGWYPAQIRVTPQSVRYSVEGFPPFEDHSPSRTSPWLMLGTSNDCQSVLRNLRLAGHPTVPREVRLVDGDRLDGWLAGNPREQLPERVSRTATLQKTSGRTRARNSAAAGSPIVWTAKDSVLTRKRDRNAPKHATSRIYYGRPLAAGETVRFQFHYQPGKPCVHPTFGQIAFVLEPDGLRLQRLDEAARQPAIVPSPESSTAASEASARNPLSRTLKENDWNDVEFTLQSNELALRLNGQLICKRKASESADRQFGFVHFPKQAAAQVRNVVLSGDWPQTLPAADSADLLTGEEKSPPPAIRRRGNQLIGEVLADNGPALLAQIEKLPADERYEQLKAWVLPEEPLSLVRLDAAITPSSRKLAAPVLDLLELAKQLGKLDQLAANTPETTPNASAHKTAFETLLAMKRGDRAAARSQLQQLAEQYPDLPKKTPQRTRQAFLLVAQVALDDAELREPALELAKRVAAPLPEGARATSDWQLWTACLLASARDNSADDEHLPANWHPVSRFTARLHALGKMEPKWNVNGDEIRRVSGGGDVGLYHAIPLRGDFTATCEHTIGPDCNLGWLYAGRAVFLSADGKLLLQKPLNGKVEITKLDQPIDPRDGWIEHRLDAKSGILTMTVNGQQVLVEKLPAEPDPWLAIVSQESHHQGAVRRLQVASSVQPEGEICLSRPGTLAGWQAGYFDQSLGRRKWNDKTPRGQPAWATRGSELVGSLFPNAPGMGVKSLLQYHCPLLTGGVVEYEFFYEPKTTVVYPALDDLVLLPTKDGVRAHKLAGPTNELVDSTGSLDLKPGEWNKVQLSLHKASVAVEINGKPVGTITLPTENQRTFGLFHCRDVSRARVRNVVYRGHWTTKPDTDTSAAAAAE